MSTKKQAKSVAWGEAHQREALIRASEILTVSLVRDLPDADALAVARILGVSPIVARGDRDVATEAGWRVWLAAAAPWADADREVRRVRALAEGRLGWHDDHGAALASLGEWRCDAEAKGARLVRVTRVKRSW